MFLGHYGVALAARRVAPDTSLGATSFAAQWLDLLWPVLLLAGVERVRIVPGLLPTNPFDFVHYPISHSLLLVLVWSALVAGAWWAWRRAPRAALVLGALVASHWFLDALMHRPDLPLWPGGAARVGLGLWRSVAATVVVELALFAAGLATYVRATRPVDRTGSWALWSLVAVLLLIFVGSLAGEVPPSARAVALAGLGLWLFVPWFHWIDAHREPRGLVRETAPRAIGRAARG